MRRDELVGVILDPHVLAGILRHKRRGAERVRFYHRAAKQLGLTVICTSLSSINFRRRSVRGWIYKDNRWVKATVDLPRVFHNRSMPFDTVSKARLKRLCHAAVVFNCKTRYSKLTIHKIMMKNAPLRPHVPRTVRFSNMNLARMMNTYNELFIKPVSGSIGKGIVAMTRLPSGQWRLQQGVKRAAFAPRKASSIVCGKIKPKRYLIQEGIRLARYKGRPFDLRVSVQRGATGAWNVTGIVGKVAAPNKRVTNLGRGGKAVPPAKLFHSLGWNGRQTEANVQRVALAAAEGISRRLEGLADLGFDIGLSAEGKPYIIEMNGRDQRYSFLKAGMKKEFYQTYATPMAYAAYLLRSGKTAPKLHRR